MLIEDVDFLPETKEPTQKEASVSRNQKLTPKDSSGTERVSRAELRLFASTLGSLLRGGIPLLKSLQVLRKESRGKVRFAAVIGRVEESVRQGQSFSTALQNEPRSFPVFFTRMVEAGENSGNLETVLQLLTEHLEREDERRRKVIEAATYPAIVLALGFVTFAVLLKFVIPQISSVYTDFDADLPALTRAVLAASDAVVPFSILMIALLVPAVYFYRKNQDAAAGYLLKLPLIGSLIKKHLLSVFSSMLALELKSGIPILTALDSVRQTVPWHFFQSDILRVQANLTQGGWLADSLRPLVWMPEAACVLIHAGQESGRLPEALEQVNREASREFEVRVHFTLKVLEPLLILGVGVVVGLIVLSAILPILEINTLVR